ncbi:FAD dependent oxidoreductase [Xylariaceae sp. FL0016]|nr:FAD dependent oxidoreductase [Xylariaceae sp. FL0016]
MANSALLPGQSGLPVPNPTASYWHKEPSQTLLGHRTTEQLPKSADVVIVGSGITGTMAAEFLREKMPAKSVVMLEAREACWGATGRNGGHCQPNMYAGQPHIASFELRNYSCLKTLVENFNIPCDWHTTTGVHAFYNKELFSIAKGLVEDLTDKYPDLAANVALVTKGEGGSPAWLLKEERKELTLEGLRVGGAEGAVVQWHAASLWPYKLVTFVLERLLAASVREGKGLFNLQTGTAVTGISQTTNPTSQRSKPDEVDAQPGRMWTVHTPRGDIAASQILLATNGYTSHLLPSFSDLLVPVQGQISALKPPQEPKSPSDPPLDIGHTFVIEGEPDAPFDRDDYLIQRPPPTAELIYGGGRGHAKGRAVGVWDDSEIDDPVAWYLRGELSGLVDLSLRHGDAAEQDYSGKIPKQDLNPTHEWTGIMGYSRDGHPFVGAVPQTLGGGDGLWVCAGYTGHGMPNAALCAKAVVDMMVAEGRDGEGDVEIDLPPEYEITPERLAAARLKETVREVDERGSLFADFGAG